jgi:chemotaxis protein CheD
MAISPSTTVLRHYLNPCALIARRCELEITTLLGSCVSVCLWDPHLACGGMNHYMLPLWNGDGLPTPKYGNVAIENLIEKMLELGCRKEHLVAKCFGGANVLGDNSGRIHIGERNSALAEELLMIHRIPVVAQEVGGLRGMKIIFNTKSGLVLVGRLSAPSSMTS